MAQDCQIWEPRIFRCSKMFFLRLVSPAILRITWPRERRGYAHWRPHIRCRLHWVWTRDVKARPKWCCALLDREGCGREALSDAWLDFLPPAISASSLPLTLGCGENKGKGEKKTENSLIKILVHFHRCPEEKAVAPPLIFKRK